MLTKKSALIITHKDGSAKQEIMVPTFFIKQWKKITLGFFGLVFLICGLVVYAATSKTEEDLTTQYELTIKREKEVNRQLSIRQNDNQKDLTQAVESFSKLDSTLERINEKLKSRGLKTFKTANAGGPIELDENNFELLSDYYTSTLKDVDKKLSGVPLGLPHKGRVTSKFGYRRNPFTNKGRELHSGVDLKGNKGDPIAVTASGKVSFSGYEGEYGNVVKVKHPNGFETRYAHLSQTRVKKGQNIEAGAVVGLLGSTGRSTGPHLHYEILKNDKKIDPEKYFHF